ncbi:MAG: hypothetical protein E6H08_09985 [Bacteroidetes bacterium]|nr:MAG: hypothetical protein E6H08_09985 [Bacteroidota bacterium]
MELDDLKQTWKETTIKKNKNTDIMDIMKHKSYGPIAALKREFRKQIVVMALLPLFLLITTIDDISKIYTNVLFWSYVAFCVGMIVFASVNYRIVEKMEIMDVSVRSNLQQQIDLLETRLKWKLIGLRIILLFFIILVEVVPYFQHYRMLDKWHSLSPFIRFGAYAAFLILQYFLSRIVSDRKFGGHIKYLKELMKEMQ